MIASKLTFRRGAKAKASLKMAILMFVIIDPKRVELVMSRLKLE